LPHSSAAVQPEEKAMMQDLRKRMTVRQVSDIMGLSEATIVKYSKGNGSVRLSPLNRTQFEVIRDVLAAIRDSKKGLRPTHVMYKANLSHDQLLKYLELLSVNGFIMKDEAGFWHLKRKGRQWLKNYGCLSKALKRRKS